MGESGWRPRVIVDAAKIAALRSQGLSRATIGEALGRGRANGQALGSCIRQKPL
jgi:hypothetical protein